MAGTKNLFILQQKPFKHYESSSITNSTTLKAFWPPLFVCFPREEKLSVLAFTRLKTELSKISSKAMFLRCLHQSQSSHHQKKSSKIHLHDRQNYELQEKVPLNIDNYANNLYIKLSSKRSRKEYNHKHRQDVGIALLNVLFG